MPVPADRFSLVILDMNGTTVHDSGVFDSSLSQAFASVDLPTPPKASVASYRGMSKSEMFRQLIPDARLADRAYQQFVAVFLDAVAAGAIRPIPAAGQVLQRLHDLGLCTALITGFPHNLEHAIIEKLGWSRLIDLSVSSDEVPRGRPHPDIIHYASKSLGVDNPERVVVVGDTLNDLLAGERANAGLVVGVLTGSHGAKRLRDVTVARLIPSVADLPDLLSAVLLDTALSSARVEE